jgi:hypothetical protein
MEAKPVSAPRTGSHRIIFWKITAMPAIMLTWIGRYIVGDMRKSIGLASIGFLLSSTALFLYIAIAVALKGVGLPPRSWFGSDYTDPRCAVISGAMALFVLGFVSFVTAGLLGKLFGMAGALGAFWLSNPISTSLGLLLARRLIVNVVPPEFTAPVLFLVVFGWPVAWHLSLSGFRAVSPAKATAIAAAYAGMFLAVGLVRVSPRYLN